MRPSPLIKVILSLVIVIVVTALTAGQDKFAQSTSAGPTLTVTATGNSVRFTAPSTVVKMRVEILDAFGQRLFDNEVRGGNVFDWHVQNGQAERLADGSYVCVVLVG
jgi:hypothetical protein